MLVFLDGASAGDHGGSEVFERGRCLTLHGNEVYDSKGLSLSGGRIKRMREYARKKGTGIAGDAFGETLCRWPRLFDEGFALGHRLCLPIRYGQDNR